MLEPWPGEAPERPSSAEAPVKPARRGRLTPRQQAFVAAYTNPESDTYSNGTQSALAVYDSKTPESAHVTASRLLQRATVQAEIADILREQGIETRDRVRILHSISQGETRRRTTQTVRDGDGVVKQVLETEAAPTFGERTQALHLLNKLSGDYEKPRVAADLVRAEYKELARRMRKELDPRRRTGSQEAREAAQGEAHEGEGD